MLGWEDIMASSKREKNILFMAFSAINVRTKLDVLSLIFYSGILSYLSVKVFIVTNNMAISQYWVIFPIVLFMSLNLFTKIFRFKVISVLILGASTIISLLILGIIIKSQDFTIFFQTQEENILIVIAVLFLFTIMANKVDISRLNQDKQSKISYDLFNLFYVNTPKVHEIVMLIDNKIMKTIEREQISEELLRYNSSISLQNSTTGSSANLGYSKEDNTKKSVYESFDVKTTKSIMLRRLYEAIKRQQVTNHNLGDVVIFKNIELKQRNINDTVMLLNILEDAKIKNLADENVEINLSKMMNKMLDDFTIDYIFSYDISEQSNSNYIIQLPYKADNNFENGYLHNDLQLGKLSLIGIYRGEIDFSSRENISSKFLELASQATNDDLNKITLNPLKSSSSNEKQSDILDIKWQPDKLKEKLHLIDVVAIIQELNIVGADDNGI